MAIDKEWWQFFNSFAPWLSAIGTIAAVIAALYLARRADRILLQIRAGIRTIAIQGGGPDHGEEVVWVYITNFGRRNATITHLFWKPVPWRKAGLIWIAPQNQYSSAFPITLDDGDAANYALSVEDFRNNFRDYARDFFSGFLGKIRLVTLRFCVSTSTGDTFTKRPEKKIRKLLRELATRNA